MRTASFTATITLVIGLLFLGGILYVLIGPTTTSTFAGESDIDLTITGGELDNLFGFGDLDNELSTPGPTITIKNGQIVKIIFENIGEIPHTFRISDGNTTDSTILFNASIGDNSNPIAPGQLSTVTFQAEKSGTFHYICSIPGHADRGMIGIIIIEDE